jgi:4-hydroxybutyrate CoA-transferase
LLFGHHPFVGRSSFKFATWQSSPPLGRWIAEGKVDYLPLRYSQLVSTFLPRGVLPVDAILIRVSPPDGRGYCSIGVSPSFSLPVALSTKKVIAEISEEIPRSPGNSFIHQSRITSFVESTFSPTEYRTGDISPEEQKTAENVVEVIEDGSTIEVGIGNIPAAVTRKLASRREIGFHSGMVNDDIIGLIESGAVPIKRLNRKNRVVVGELIGTKRLFSFAHENPLFRMATVPDVYSPGVLSQIPKFVAINSAMEVDLSGQVNSETIDHLQVGGVGGSFDFCVGASLSPGGKAIIALKSAAKRGTVSRIVSQFSAGSAVTIPRHYVDYVVTEHGIAHLYGKNLAQRAEALIAIAHPNFRDELSNQFERKLRSQ